MLFSKNQLDKFYKFGKKSYLEKIEDIEILRFFELNIPIKMVSVSKSSIAVDIKRYKKSRKSFEENERN